MKHEPKPTTHRCFDVIYHGSLSGALQVKAFDVVNECYVHATIDFSSEVAVGACRVTLPGA